MYFFNYSSRLFLGMGIIWYFELLSFATSTEEGDGEWSYFTDCLNMLQVGTSPEVYTLSYFPFRESGFSSPLCARGTF